MTRRATWYDAGLNAAAGGLTEGLDMSDFSGAAIKGLASSLGQGFVTGEWGESFKTGAIATAGNYAGGKFNEGLIGGPGVDNAYTSKLFENYATFGCRKLLGSDEDFNMETISQVNTIQLLTDHIYNGIKADRAAEEREEDNRKKNERPQAHNPAALDEEETSTQQKQDDASNDPFEPLDNALGGLFLTFGGLLGQGTRDVVDAIADGASAVWDGMGSDYGKIPEQWVLSVAQYDESEVVQSRFIKGTDLEKYADRVATEYSNDGMKLTGKDVIDQLCAANGNCTPQELQGKLNRGEVINEPANMCWNSDIQTPYEKERIERQKAEMNMFQFEDQPNRDKYIPGISTVNIGNSYMSNIAFTDDYTTGTIPGVDISNIGSMKMSDLAFTGDYEMDYIPGIDIGNVGNIRMNDLAFTGDYQMDNMPGIDLSNTGKFKMNDVVFTNDYEKYYKSDPVYTEQWQKNYDAGIDAVKGLGEEFVDMSKRWGGEGSNLDMEYDDSAVAKKREYEYYRNNTNGFDALFPLPGLEDNITSGFGNRIDPQYNEPRFHDGIDIGAKVGTDVYAADDGEVILAEENGNYGKYVEIKHKDGYNSFYAHLDGYNAKQGQYVKRGDIIAKSGNTGRVTGKGHLHFGMKYNGNFIRPKF